MTTGVGRSRSISVTVSQGPHKELQVHFQCISEAFILFGQFLGGTLQRRRKEPEVVAVWSGREAQALRAAMRLSIDDFAGRAGVSRRSVAKWSQLGTRTRLRWDVQRNLDQLLSSAGPEVHARLTELLERPERAPTGGTDPIWASTLVAALLDPPPPVEGARARPLLHLERAIARARMALQACQYGIAVGEIVRLLPALAVAGADPQLAFPWRVRKIASDAYDVLAWLLLKLEEVPLAMLAAQRCEREAEASGQPLAIAAGRRATVRVLTRCGQEHHAATLAAQAADRLSESTALDGPRPLSAYGALLLRGAEAHACAGGRTEAMTLLGEAAAVARRLGMDGNFGWTAFGPTDVALHRISALLALGDPGMALHVARGVDPHRITVTERRVALHLDTAQAWHRLGNDPAARAALEWASTLAPDEVRLRSANRALAEQLKLSL
jgi:transcriptional regulator with XRE-family HTH domain